MTSRGLWWHAKTLLGRGVRQGFGFCGIVSSAWLVVSAAFGDDHAEDGDEEASAHVTGGSDDGSIHFDHECADDHGGESRDDCAIGFAGECGSAESYFGGEEVGDECALWAGGAGHDDGEGEC